ncbi:MAG TPA: PQQ-binding-like beta-propeller repeat protein [Gemmataceae bacterium]|jgi:hypothetical protein|nr:PQQ-binding-like beta-propeller repeat protein [Gemmataceae bacterium]
MRHSIRWMLVIVLISHSTLAPAQTKQPLPDLSPIWKTTTIGLPTSDDLTAEVNRPAVDYIKALYQLTEVKARELNRPIIPPAVPIGNGGLVYYTNNHGVAVRTVTFGTAFGERFQRGELFWASEGDFDLHNMTRELGQRVLLDAWRTAPSYSPICDAVLNQTSCRQIAIQGDFVLHVDDAGFLPPPKKPEDVLVSYGVHNDAVGRTLIRDIDIPSGKLLRKFGNFEWLKDSRGSDFIVLGLPLVDGDARIFLTERGVQVHLLKIDFPKYCAAHFNSGPDRAIEASRKWEIELARAPKRLIDDPHRRTHALHLVEAQGLIIAPTNLGRIVAVDSVSGKIRWTHEYAAIKAKRFPTFLPEWIVVPPVVVRDRYVYAPADFPELLCLNATDGKKIWTAKKGDGLYPAVVGEQVLVIGRTSIRSLKLLDGAEQWKVDLPGLPCGRGVVLGDNYLVPVSEPKTWKGLIAVVDLKTTKLVDVLRPEKNQPIGNLVVHQDFLISQTLTELAVFPIKK